jgi:hypothetical protein
MDELVSEGDGGTKVAIIRAFLGWKDDLQSNAGMRGIVAGIIFA